MNKKVFIIATTVLALIAIIEGLVIVTSCNEKNKEVDKITPEIDYQKIEMITNRKVITIDSTQLDSLDRKYLSTILREERDRFTQGVKLALGYDLKGGYEIIHLYHKPNHDCRFTCCHYNGCPKIYAQLTNNEYEKLMERFKFYRGKHEDDVKDHEGATFHRTFIYTPNGITVFLEGHESCCEETVSLQLDAMTKIMTYHFHHHYWCQTGSSCHTYYEWLWEKLHHKKQDDGIGKKSL